MHRGLQRVDLRIIEELWKVIIKERNPSNYSVLKSSKTVSSGEGKRRTFYTYF